MYFDWVKSESARIRADGCSGPATNAYVFYCLEHDLHYFYAKSASDAYELFKDGMIPRDAWKNAKPVTREEADECLKFGIRHASKAGKWSPMAWWRYLILAKWKRGQKAWDKHREREAKIISNAELRDG